MAPDFQGDRVQDALFFFFYYRLCYSFRAVRDGSWKKEMDEDRPWKLSAASSGWGGSRLSPSAGCLFSSGQASVSRARDTGFEPRSSQSSQTSQVQSDLLVVTSQVQSDLLVVTSQVKLDPLVVTSQVKTDPLVVASQVQLDPLVVTSQVKTDPLVVTSQV